MSSRDIETIYKKLLESYANLSRGGDTLWILNSHIEAYARNQWNAKEPAILDLALRSGVRIPDLESLISEGLQRDDAILRVSKKMKFQVSEAQAKKWLEHYRKEMARKEASEQKILKASRDYERGVNELTALFSKGEISEESYKVAVRKIEKERELRQGKPVSPDFEKSIAPPLQPGISAREIIEEPETRIRSIAKYFVHGLAYSFFSTILTFGWALLLSVLVVIGLILGLIIGVLIWFFIFGYLNRFLADVIWHMDTNSSIWMTLAHGLLLVIIGLIVGIPATIALLAFPSLDLPGIMVKVVVFLIMTPVHGYVGKLVASWFPE